jgi:hypothetical protein
VRELEVMREEIEKMSDALKQVEIESSDKDRVIAEQANSIIELQISHQ